MPEMLPLFGHATIFSALHIGLDNGLFQETMKERDTCLCVTTGVAGGDFAVTASTRGIADPGYDRVQVAVIHKGAFGRPGASTGGAALELSDAGLADS